MGGNETRVVAKKKRSDVRQSESCIGFLTIREESFSHQNDLSRRTIREYRRKSASIEINLLVIKN